jgi:hypothetical protein
MQARIFDRIQQPFIITVLHKLGLERAHFNITKAVYEKLIINIILPEEKLKPSPLKSGIR